MIERITKFEVNKINSKHSQSILFEWMDACRFIFEIRFYDKKSRRNIMFPFAFLPTLRFLNNNLSARLLSSTRKLLHSMDLDNKYSDEEKVKIIQVINESDAEVISRYGMTKARLKHFSRWKSNNGSIQTLSDMHIIEGFSEKIAKKLFDSILKGPVVNEPQISNRIKGQFLQPTLSPAVVKNCRTVLTVYTTASSVSWTLINKENYEVLQWKYHGIQYPDAKKLPLTDILEIGWSITNKLPVADVYVMKAETTTLRAAGSDPNNPKVLVVNLQRAQLVAVLVTLINMRDHNIHGNELQEESTNTSDKLRHKVYFLRPSLPYRLYGTLVGNEKVSTDQAVDMLLQNRDSSCLVSEELINMFRSQKDLEKDMLGHCLLLSLTFMDLCVYKNQQKIAKLLKQGD